MAAAIPKTPTLRRLESIAGAAEYAGVHPRTIRRNIAAGRLTGYRMGPRLIRVDLNELDAMLRPIPTAAAGGIATQAPARRLPLAQRSERGSSGEGEGVRRVEAERDDAIGELRESGGRVV